MAQRSLLLLIAVAASCCLALRPQLEPPKIFTPASASRTRIVINCAPSDEPPAAAENKAPPPPPPPLSSLSSLAATQDELQIAATSAAPTAACDVRQTPDERRRSLLLGVTAPIAAAALYAFQRANPVNPVKLLAAMEARSPALPEALASGTPTLLEFYAPWCISCREAAPAMMRFEKRYEGKVNFVVCNAEDPQYADIVRYFGVDGIPHLALIDEKKKLRSTLIGEVPETVVGASLKALANGTPLPYDEGTAAGPDQTPEAAANRAARREGNERWYQ